ncbi:MAG: TraB/GumN family protein, partial [Bacteroidota bacterium]
MNYNLKSVAFLAMACFVILFSCQAQQETKTLLWKIEGKDIQTSYLYGTFHILPEEDFLLKDKVKTAFNACEQLALELDMDHPQLQAEMFQHITMTTEQTLSDFFTQAELDTMNNWAVQSAGFGIDNMMNWKPFLVSTMFLNRFNKAI